jgi:hypothetical protein
MLQRKLDKHMCFSKAVNFFVNIWSLLIFQQLTLTAAATSIIAAVVLQQWY